MYELSNTTTGVNYALWVILGISAFLTVAITAVMIYFVIRYRKSANSKPAQIHGNLPLELAWTIIPVFIALYMFQVGWSGYDVYRKPADGSMEIDVWGMQFRWDYEYPSGKSTTRDLVVPAGQPILLNLHSRDVNHSFFLPDYGIKEDVVPGLDNSLAFTPLLTGIYDIFCTEYCGLDHSGMLGRLIVKEPHEFYDWYKQAEAQEPIVLDEVMAATPEQIARGKSVYNLNCVSCHGPEGRGEALPEARNFRETDGWKNGRRVSEIFRTLAYGIEGTQMASFKHLPVDDRFAVAHYVREFMKQAGQEPPADDAQMLAALDEEFSLTEGKAAPPQLPVDFAMERMLADVGGAGASAEPPAAEDLPATVSLTNGLYR